jgi:hypothetical protein
MLKERKRVDTNNIFLKIKWPAIFFQCWQNNKIEFCFFLKSKHQFNVRMCYFQDHIKDIKNKSK